MAGLALAWAAGAAAEGQTSAEAKELLRLHREVIAGHLARDPAAVLAAEAESVVSVNRGEVRFVARAERERQFGSYLKDARFTRYRDLIEPIVRVSRDGTLGWVIVQVGIAGTRTGEDGKPVPLDSTWAWIELYEKRDGRWRRVGEVSSLKPPGEGP